MRETKISWFDRFKDRLFKRELKSFLVDQKYKVSPAFKLGGIKYYYFESTNEVPTGRFFAAMGIYTEMEMNCDKEYLISHTKIIDKILDDPKKTSIGTIAQLNINMKERLNLMPFPDYIYKLASVIFFDKTESLYSYDYDYNKIKIEKWKAAGGSLAFFSGTPLRELIPQLAMPERDIQTYSMVSKLINETHQELITAQLLEKQ